MAGEQRFDHHVVGLVDARYRQQRGRDRLPIHTLGFIRVDVDVAPAEIKCTGVAKCRNPTVASLAMLTRIKRQRSALNAAAVPYSRRYWA